MSGNFGFGSAGSSPPRRQTADIVVENHASIFILRGLTNRGHAWVEHRYIRDIVTGALADGLEVE